MQYPVALDLGFGINYCSAIYLPISIGIFRSVYHGSYHRYPVFNLYLYCLLLFMDRVAGHFSIMSSWLFFCLLSAKHVNLDELNDIFVDGGFSVVRFIE